MAIFYLKAVTVELLIGWYQYKISLNSFNSEVTALEKLGKLGSSLGTNPGPDYKRSASAGEAS